MGWDFDAQKADTEAVVRQFAEEHDLPAGMPIDLDVQTIPADGADKAGLVIALKAAGYAIRIYPGEDGVETVEAHKPGVTFDAETIWSEERAVTEIALAHGYAPDGWGFMEPEE